MVAKRKPDTAQGEWQPQRRRFSIDEFDRMIRAGVVREGERVELLDGEVVCMAAMGTRHAARLRWLQNWFGKRLPDTAMLSSQLPVRVSSGSLLEPDLAILRVREDMYAGSHPDASDILLLIEVSDTSIGIDRNAKLPRYAAAGIVESWIFDIGGDRALIHRRPRGRRYTDIQTVQRGGTLAPLAFPELTIKLDDVLGPPASQA
ncbi:MAG TPA: Uma2 family endonuclease [Dehalococcoidia bacterium]